jgi:hypothetical protein
MKKRLLLLAVALVVSVVALTAPVAALTCFEGCSNHVRLLCCPEGAGCIKAGTC